MKFQENNEIITRNNRCELCNNLLSSQGLEEIYGFSKVELVFRSDILEEIICLRCYHTLANISDSLADTQLYEEDLV